MDYKDLVAESSSMACKGKIVGIDESDSGDSSTDLDEYYTAEEDLDCDEDFLSFDECSVQDEVLTDEYPDIEFIDCSVNSEKLNREQSSEREAEINIDIVHAETVRDSYVKNSNSDIIPNKDLELPDDQRLLSIQEKISFFENIVKKGTRLHKTYKDCNAEVSNSRHVDRDIASKLVDGEDSSDENDSSADIETSYEDMLESMLEKHQIPSVSRKSSSCSEEFENLDADLLVKTKHPKYTEGKFESDEYQVQAETFMLDRKFDLEKEAQRSDTNDLFALKHGGNSELRTLYKHPDDVILKLKTFQATAEQIQKDVDNSVEERNKFIESGETNLNNLSHQNHLFHAKMGFDASGNRESEMVGQESKKNVPDKAFRCNIYNTCPENIKQQNKAFLLPERLKDQIAETEEISDHMINRQSSVIKDNHLTEMPFMDHSDSEILSDMKGSQETLDTSSKTSEPYHEAVVRHVELGTALLSEGSHYKNLHCAKIINPMILNKQSNSTELRASSAPKNTSDKNCENKPNILSTSKSADNVIGLTKKEVAIIPEVIVSVTMCKEDSSEKQANKIESGEKTGALDERDRRSFSKSLRRKNYRHNAIVSDCAANIEQAESLRNSGIDDCIHKTISVEEELVKVVKETVDRHENRNIFQDSETNLMVRTAEVRTESETDLTVRTVEIGIACLYEIPHLKYLHCAKMISPSS